MKTLSPQSNS